MPIANQSMTLFDLNPYLAELASVVLGAWEDVRLLPEECQVTIGARTRASLVHDYMLKRASALEAGHSAIRYFQRQSMHGLVIDGKYAIRFKKLDEDSKSKNQPTQQVAEYRAQIELEGIDAAHHLEIGYVLNNFGTEVADVRLACPAGAGVAWASSLFKNETQTVVADLFQPVEEVEQADIRPRRQAEDGFGFNKKAVDASEW